MVDPDESAATTSAPLPLVVAGKLIGAFAPLAKQVAELSKSDLDEVYQRDEVEWTTSELDERGAMVLSPAASLSFDVWRAEDSIRRGDPAAYQLLRTLVPACDGTHGGRALVAAVANVVKGAGAADAGRPRAKSRGRGLHTEAVERAVELLKLERERLTFNPESRPRYETKAAVARLAGCAPSVLSESERFNDEWELYKLYARSAKAMRVQRVASRVADADPNGAEDIAQT